MNDEKLIDVWKAATDGDLEWNSLSNYLFGVYCLGLDIDCDIYGYGIAFFLSEIADIHAFSIKLCD